MACIDKIADNVLNSCEDIPRSGFEPIAWAINRTDIDVVTHDTTYDTLVEAITRIAEKRAYNVTAVKKEMNAGFDLVTGDDIPDTYKNFFSFKPYEKTPQAIANLDSMNDLVVIAELKGEKSEGCFVIYGLEKGLYKSSGTQRQNDSNGLPIYEMQSQEGQGERYSRFVFWDTDYATSKVALIALLYGSVLNVSDCENMGYPTFANATPTGFDASDTGSGLDQAGTADEISIVNDTSYLVEFDEVLNGGVAPDVQLAASLSGISLSNQEASIHGSNSFILTATGTDTAVLQFSSSLASDYEITNLSIRKIL